MKKIIWEKYVSRRSAVQIIQAWNFGFGSAMQKFLGISIKNTLVFRDRQKTDYYTDKKQFEDYFDGLAKLLNNKKFVKFFHQQARLKMEEILAQAKGIFKNDLKKLSNRDLLKIYQEFIIPKSTIFYTRMWTVFNSGEPLPKLIRKKLAHYVDEKSLDDYMLILSKPFVPNDAMNQRVDLLKLALAKKSLTKNGFQKKLNLHTQKYRHIPVYDFDHEPYTNNDFLRELSLIKNQGKELREIRKLFLKRKKEFATIIKKIKPNRNFKDLLMCFKENVWLRDYRDMIRQKLNLEFTKFYKEAGARIGLKLEEIIALTNEEIISYLKSGKIFPKSEVKNRSRAFLLIQIGDKARIYSGRQAELKFAKEVKTGKFDNVKEVRGLVGSSGFARGRAKIIYTNKDLYKIKNGDVLITTMTRQDFVPAMRKAVAIVTDEGSIAAHAAIIARELKKPCIVATKIGTKVFKDNDLVEVDATQGIVNKINY